MQYFIKKDKVKRNYFLRKESSWLTLKAIAANQFISSRMRWTARLRLGRMIKLNSFTCFNNRCILSGNSRSVDRYTHLSRHMFRRLAVDGRLGGIRKATW
jgi:ribosomal protein S14